MRQRIGIVFFALVILAGAAVTAAMQFGYHRAREKALMELAAEEENKTSGGAVAADGQAMDENSFYLMESNGYVIVYLSDGTTIYEYTDIRVDALPADVQTEIRNGKYMGSPEELYGFLESYTS